MEDNLIVKHVNESKETAHIVHNRQKLPKLMNVDQATKVYEDLKSQWLEAPCRKQLITILNHFHSDHPWKITKAVSLAIGSFTKPDRDGCHETDCRCIRSFNQLVMFMDIAETVLKSNKRELKIFSQDPAYKPLDKAFLKSLNVEVVDDDKVQQQIDNETLVFAPFWGQDSEIWAQCQHRQPCVYIGISLEEQIDKLCDLADLDPKPKGSLPSEGWAALERLIGHLEKAEADCDISGWETRRDCTFCYASIENIIYWRKSASDQTVESNDKKMKQGKDTCSCSQSELVRESVRKFLEIASNPIVAEAMGKKMYREAAAPK